MRINNNPDLTVKKAGAIFPLMMFCVATGMPFGVKFMRKVKSARKACLIGTVLMALWVFISSFIKYFWPFTLVYGVLFGLTSGTIYMIPIYVGFLNFPKKRGTVSGIILTGKIILNYTL